MLARVLFIPLAVVVAYSMVERSKAPIAANDNRVRAGHLREGVLTVNIEAREGVWHPEGAKGLAIETAAFAEQGKTLQTPGPLIRVPVGTEVRATITNRLDKAMWLHGMGASRGMRDSVNIAPHVSHRFTFKATEPGVFYYAGRTGPDPVAARLNGDSQLGGVIPVDPPNARADVNERILAITSWFTIDARTKSGLGPNSTIAFNGGAWPATDRLTFTQGDTVHFRIANMSILDHPLHLHGFYFTVDAKGDGARDTIYTADERRSAVTEYVAPMSTMSMRWVAERPGNWIFHCHFASHMANRASFKADRTDMTPHMQHASSSMLDHMSSLVIGMSATRSSLAGRLTRPMQTRCRCLARCSN
ncbi:MAG TPA: multicopper oxidase domain-containing protein [Gemmatimonadaceae bacterium]|nr:multicopper oxidase domain-containing protein [Gemmatimonadaceae bacterium]